MADARLAAINSEALTPGDQPARLLGAINQEALTNNEVVPVRRLSGLNTESLTSVAAPPVRMFSGMTIEVLVPAQLSYIGWGVPVRGAVWT